MGGRVGNVTVGPTPRCLRNSADVVNNDFEWAEYLERQKAKGNLKPFNYWVSAEQRAVVVEYILDVAQQRDQHPRRA